MGGAGNSGITGAQPLTIVSGRFLNPVLTRRRIALAFVVAIIADAIQLLLGPLGWTFLDEVMDVVAMGLTTVLLGFHPLLLPTFFVEFIPVVDMFPTWTACVSVVAALRWKQQKANSASVSSTDVIDV
jgi:hypothetical protein